MPMTMDAPPPVFTPSTQGPMLGPPRGATPLLGQMAGMVPTPGESPSGLLTAAGNLLLRAAQQAQASGDMSLAPIVAQALSLLTDWSSQHLQGQESQMGGVALPQLESPLQHPPLLPREGMPPPGMPPMVR